MIESDDRYTNEKRRIQDLVFGVFHLGWVR
jgi:hypothetical protein